MTSPMFSGKLICLIPVIFLFSSCPHSDDITTEDLNIDESNLITITYDSDGATSGIVPVDNNKYLPDKNIIVKGNIGELTKDGYYFGGWENLVSEGMSFYSRYNYPGDEITGTKTTDITLYALWYENRPSNDVTVTYDANGADSGSIPEAMTCEQYDLIEVRGNVGNLTKSGYYFKGWDKDPDAHYISNTYKQGNEKKIYRDTTWYASWFPGQKIIYDANGATEGSVPIDPGNHDPDFNMTLLGNSGDLKKGSEIFQGWSSLSTSSFHLRFEGDSIGISDTSESYTLYAIYAEPKRGVFGPAGGYIIYDDESNGVDNLPGFRFLEVEKEDLSGEYIWGIVGNNITGADEIYSGSGIQNTLDILASEFNLESAAYACSNYKKTYSGKEYDDWFLPSKSELNNIDYTYGAILSRTGNLKSNCYWSSSESSENDAYLYDFSFAAYYNITKSKDTKAYVRPIRAFN